MKTAAIVLSVLVLIAGAAIGYELFNTALELKGTYVQTFSASEREQEFQSLRNAAEQNAVQGTLLRGTKWQTSGHYTYHVYTLRLKNSGLLPAEMVEMQVVPIAEDVLFYGETGKIDLAPGEERNLSVVLLSEGQPHEVREIKITYYIWGHAQEVKFTCEGDR